MPKHGLPGLENFVSPGQLENPFGNKNAAFTKTSTNSHEDIRRPWPSQAVQSKARDRRPVSAGNGFSSPALPHPRRGEKTEPPLVAAPYYITSMTKKYLETQINEGHMTKDELPLILELALHIANAYRRSGPTASDMELALAFRNYEKMERIARGEETIDIFRKDARTGDPLPPRQMRMYWQNVASGILKHIKMQAVPQFNGVSGETEPSA